MGLGVQEEDIHPVDRGKQEGIRARSLFVKSHSNAILKMCWFVGEWGSVLKNVTCPWCVEWC